MRAYTWRVEDPVDNPDALVEALGELERRGFKVECAALAERMRRRERDDYLRAAHELLSGTAWGRCIRLEKEISTFEALVWPRWHARETPPEPCSALRRALFEARKLGALPSTARQLWNILKRGGCCDFGETRVQSPDPSEVSDQCQR